jgi:hypothetical protein
MKTKIKTTRRRYPALIASPYSHRVPLHGSVCDTRISSPPVVKSEGPKQLFIPSIAKKLMTLVVRVKELLGAPGIL